MACESLVLAQGEVPATFALNLTMKWEKVAVEGKSGAFVCCLVRWSAALSLALHFPFDSIVVIRCLLLAVHCLPLRLLFDDS